MSELLIPFGIHRDTGDIVEPEDAAKGRACDCLCPGCKAPLLCRHPKVNRDHFAHDSRHENARPEQECPFSSAVAAAMMVREMAPEFVGELFATPELSVGERCRRCRDYQSIMVTRSAHNVIDTAQANVSLYGHWVDLKLTVAGFTLLVDLVYKGKPHLHLDEDALQQDKVSLLELDCDRFKMRDLKRHRNIRFSQAITAFFLNARNKHWRFHPRTKLLREQVRQEHQAQCVREYTTRPKLPDKPVSKAALPNSTPQSVQMDPALAMHRKPYGIKPTLQFDGVVEEMTVHPRPKPATNKLATRDVRQRSKPHTVPSTTLKKDLVIRHFECVLCKLCWTHRGSHAWKCPQCSSHLYAKKIE